MLLNSGRNVVTSFCFVAAAKQLGAWQRALLDKACLCQQIVVDAFANNGIFPVLGRHKIHAA